MAKCYFAKHKLVWEVLDGGLKSKIEIQWSDICGLKMFCPENEPGTLEIAVRAFKYTLNEYAICCAGSYHLFMQETL